MDIENDILESLHVESDEEITRMNEIDISIVDEPIIPAVQPQDIFHTPPQVDIWRTRLYNLLYNLDGKVLRRICKGTKEKRELLKSSGKDMANFIATSVVSPQGLADTLPNDILLLLCRKINPGIKISASRLLKTMFITYIYNQK